MPLSSEIKSINGRSATSLDADGFKALGWNRMESDGEIIHISLPGFQVLVLSRSFKRVKGQCEGPFLLALAFKEACGHQALSLWVSC